MSDGDLLRRRESYSRELAADRLSDRNIRWCQILDGGDNRHLGLVVPGCGQRSASFVPVAKTSLSCSGIHPTDPIFFRSADDGFVISFRDFNPGSEVRLFGRVDVGIDLPDLASFAIKMKGPPCCVGAVESCLPVLLELDLLIVGLRVPVKPVDEFFLVLWREITPVLLVRLVIQAAGS